MTILFAQPYDITTEGFYFKSVRQYTAKAEKLVNAYGHPVEEFEIQFIDGENIDAELFHALNVHQGNFPAFLEAVTDWEDDDKIRVLIAVGDAGYHFELGKDSPDQFDMDLYEMDSLKELAYHFVEEGLCGEIPRSIQYYIDYDAIASDLGMDYSEVTIIAARYVYRMG